MRVNNYHFLVLDIETSTLYNELGEPTATWLAYGYCNLYYRDGGRVEKFYFREWDKLGRYLNVISQRFVGYKICCYVHNLGYEFDYLIKNLSRPSNFLTNSTHAVISSVLEDFPQIEFRCSLRLTMKSLRELGNLVGLPKLEDDYPMILPSDEISEEHKNYCCRDCDIVGKYIGEHLLVEYNTFTNIPLTKTGRVRKIYNKYYTEYVKKIGRKPSWDLLPPEDCYDAMNNAFMGGCTFSNPLFTGIVLKDVHSYDISSSYPFAQLSEQFPYTIEREYNIENWMLKEKFWIAKIKFKNIKSKFNWNWLSVSKMNDFDPLTSDFFNGKLISSNWVTRTITNIDFEMINKTYYYDSLEILEFYHMYKFGDLPEPYINTIKECAKSKYEWKIIDSNTPKNSPNYFDVHTKYMLAKGDFNSIYGMSVQKIIHQEYEIDELFRWAPKKSEYKYSNKHIRRNFLFGVFVTAYARRNLLNAIIENCPYTFVYCDTDSIKFICAKYFKNTNKPLPKEYENIEYLSGIGQFDCDGKYKEFLCYGAKKYAYTLYNDDNVYLTVAGLPKFKNDKEMEIIYRNKKYKNLKRITDFKLGMTFKNCKLGKKYITITNTFDIDDDYEYFNYKETDDYTSNFLNKNKIKSGGGVALYSTDYTLDITKNDANIILKNREVLELWVKEYKITHGIDLTEYFGTKQLIG